MSLLGVRFYNGGTWLYRGYVAILRIRDYIVRSGYIECTCLY